MFLRILTLIFLSVAIISCNKPDPNPELKDPIFGDLNSRLAATTQALEAEKKALLGFEQELKDVVPQTGQIKYAQKRVYESQAKIMKLGQEEKYLKMKVSSRKLEAKRSYAEAFKKGEEWPNASEFTVYEAQNKMRAAKTTWNANARAKAVSPDKPKAGGHGESGAEGGKEEKPAEGGGHH